jgi:hypothetical protein
MLMSGKEDRPAAKQEAEDKKEVMQPTDHRYYQGPLCAGFLGSNHQSPVL